MRFNFLITACLTAAMLIAAPVYAEGKSKTYDEVTFIKMLGNKSMKQVTEALGEPAKKQLSVKPASADTVVNSSMANKSEKPVNIEMWYYNNLVRYDDKRTYKTAELTFVNGRCNSVAFFNNK